MTNKTPQKLAPSEYLEKMERALLTNSDVPWASGVTESAMKEIDRLFNDQTFRNMQPGDQYTLMFDGLLSVNPNGTSEVALGDRQTAEKFMSDLYQIFEASHYGE